MYVLRRSHSKTVNHLYILNMNAFNLVEKNAINMVIVIVVFFSERRAYDFLHFLTLSNKHCSLTFSSCFFFCQHNI